MANSPLPIRTLAVFALLFAATYAMTTGADSNDLKALWYAAEFLRAGDPANVYPPHEGLFTMYPPEAWIARDRAGGGAGAIYPYIYPPLWAALAAPLTGAVALGSFTAAALVVNSALFAAMPILAWRIARPGTPMAIFSVIGLIVLLFTVPGTVALSENQPQILVSFLILLALERSRAGAPLAAGGALALAAAIKLYPALFALLWLTSGERRSATSFALAGGTLGILSVALTGWPLHAEYLALIGQISGTVLHTAHSYNLGVFVGAYAWPGDFAFVPALNAAGPGAAATGWSVAATPAAWRLFAALLLACALALSARAAARLPRDVTFRAVWPAILGAVSLLSPLSWSYHFLPLIAFAPLLLDLHGTRRGLALIMLLALPISSFAVPSLLAASVSTRALQAVGTLAILGFVAAFAVAAARQTRPAERPARP